MSSFEYTAIPAPIRSEKAKSAKTPAERYALTLTDAINQMAADGWEYLRAETLPSEERSGLTGRTTLFHNLLIFRRPKAAALKPRALTEAEIKPAAPAPAAPQTTTPPSPKTQDKPAPTEAAGGVSPTASPIFSEPMRVSEKPGGDKA